MTTYTNAHQIQLSGPFEREEYIAGGTITPGHLVETYNDAGVQKCRVNSGSGLHNARSFAVEDPLQPKSATSTQSRDIDDDYVVGELVSVNICLPGARVQAWLKDGESVVIGDKLMSGADGTLVKQTTTLECVAISEEVLDLSATANTTNARISVRVI